MIYRISEVPPSVNAMFRNVPGKGRVKTGTYKKWLAKVRNNIAPIEPIKGERYELYIQIPAKTRGDIDNRIKAICDLLVALGATPDDRYMELCQIKRAEIKHVEIEVVGLA